MSRRVSFKVSRLPGCGLHLAAREVAVWVGLGKWPADRSLTNSEVSRCCCINICVRRSRAWPTRQGHEHRALSSPREEPIGAGCNRIEPPISQLVTFTCWPRRRRRWRLIVCRRANSGRTQEAIASEQANSRGQSQAALLGGRVASRRRQPIVLHKRFRGYANKVYTSCSVVS